MSKRLSITMSVYGKIYIISVHVVIISVANKTCSTIHVKKHYLYCMFVNIAFVCEIGFRINDNCASIEMVLNKMCYTIRVKTSILYLVGPINGRLASMKSSAYGHYSPLFPWTFGFDEIISLRSILCFGVGFTSMKKFNLLGLQYSIPITICVKNINNNECIWENILVFMKSFSLLSLQYSITVNNQCLE